MDGGVADTSCDICSTQRVATIQAQSLFRAIYRVIF